MGFSKSKEKEVKKVMKLLGDIASGKIKGHLEIHDVTIEYGKNWVVLASSKEKADEAKAKLYKEYGIKD